MSGDVFGSGGGAELAEALDLPLLGQVPLDPALRASGDAGAPRARRSGRRGGAARSWRWPTSFVRRRSGAIMKCLPLVS